jgi:type II secretory pathway component PulL
MARNLLSIDIGQDVVCAVLVSHNKKTVSVVRCGISVAEDTSFAGALAEVLQQVGYDNEPCRVAFGAEHFLFRTLSFPFYDSRKIHKVLAIELEENVPVDMRDVLVDSLISGKRGTDSTVVAAMMRRENMREQLAVLASLNIDPQIVTISGVQTALHLSQNHAQHDLILLNAGCKRMTMFVMHDGRLRLIRTWVFDDGDGANFVMDKNSQHASARKPENVSATLQKACREIRHTLLTLDTTSVAIPFFLTGSLADVQEVAQHFSDNLHVEVQPCGVAGIPVSIGKEAGLWRSDLMTGALALSTGTGVKRRGFNFRKEEFAGKHPLVYYRHLLPRIVVPAVLCLLVGTVYLWNDFRLRQMELRSLDKQVEEIFLETLPGTTRVVDPVQQLKVEIREHKKDMLGGASPESEIKILDILAEISVQIPTSLNIHIRRMVVDDNGILLRGLTDTFKAVDNVKNFLEKSEYFTKATINSANLARRDTGIRFELRLELNRG